MVMRPYDLIARNHIVGNRIKKKEIRLTECDNYFSISHRAEAWDGVPVITVDPLFCKPF